MRVSGMSTLGMVMGVVLAFACPTSATVIVRVEPASTIVQPGAVFDVSIVADIPTAVVGWGLDLEFDALVAAASGPPVLGSAWLGIGAADGDGLAGLAFPDSVSGQGVLLATVPFLAQDLGETDLVPAITAGDLTEGFALDPSGFAEVVIEPGHVIVTPEPTPLMYLCLTGLALFGCSRHCRRRYQSGLESLS